MSKTSFGLKHILVIVCYLSKFVIARPLKTKTSREVSERLQEIYLSFGVLKTIQHDQGTEFSSKVKSFAVFLYSLLILYIDKLVIDL